jgi:hypothetical protein
MPLQETSFVGINKPGAGCRQKFLHDAGASELPLPGIKAERGRSLQVGK